MTTQLAAYLIYIIKRKLQVDSNRSKQIKSPWYRFKDETAN